MVSAESIGGSEMRKLQQRELPGVSGKSEEQ